MQELIASLLSGGTKRIVTAALSIILIALHNKFGITLSDVEIGAIALIVSTWMAQSGLNAAKQKGLDAASQLITAQQGADAVTPLIAPAIGSGGDVEALTQQLKDLLAKYGKPSLALILCLGLAYSAPVLAQEVSHADAPIAFIVHEGDKLEFSGVCMEDKVYLATAKTIVALDAENTALKKSNISWPLVVGVVLGALVLGGAAGAGIAVATRPTQH